MLNAEQQRDFARDGFLAIEGVLDDADLRPLEAEYAALLADIAGELYRRGTIASAHAGLEFAERFARVVAEYPACIDRMNISLPLVNGAVDPESYRAHSGPAVFALLRNPKLLDVVEAVIGPEIASSPVQQMRIKPPLQRLAAANVDHSGVGNTTWHQDTVAVLPEAEATEQLTVWVAVTDADEDNGCLVSIPGSHREGALRHQAGAIAREPRVPDEAIRGRAGVPLPVRRGGVVIFHKHNIHCALPNRSARLRWSLDLRYHPVGQPSGRPAFPGFVARSRAHPETELRDPLAWARLWAQARRRIVSGEYRGPIFSDWRSAEDRPGGSG